MFLVCLFPISASLILFVFLPSNGLAVLSNFLVRKGVQTHDRGQLLGRELSAVTIVPKSYQFAVSKLVTKTQLNENQVFDLEKSNIEKSKARIYAKVDL